MKSLFERGIRSLTPWGSVMNLVDDIKQAKEDIDTFCTDMKTAGRKAGYDEAALIYEPKLKDMDAAYESLRKTFDEDVAKHKNDIEHLMGVLKNLESRRDRLRQRKMSLSNSLNQRASTMSGVGEQCIGTTSSARFMGDALHLVAEIKRKQGEKAHVEAFEEAKALYEKKMAMLQDEYDKLKRAASSKTQELIGLIKEISVEIANLSCEIVDLEGVK